MTERLNACCTACRLAKVKCLREDTDETCKRCNRLGIECLVEKRRSKWSNRQPKTPLESLPPSEQSVYGGLIEQVAQMPPSSLGATCFQHKVRSLLAELVEQAILRKDAATLAWAVGQISAHAIPLDQFPQFRCAGDGLVREASSELSTTTTAMAPLAQPDESIHNPLLILPPHLAAAYASSMPCIFSVADDAKPKRYFPNAASDMSPDVLNRASSPQELIAALRMHPADATRMQNEIGTAWQRERMGAIERARHAPDGDGAAAQRWVELSTLLCRMEGSDDDDKRWALHAIRMSLCATNGGQRMLSLMRFTRVAKRRDGVKRQKTGAGSLANSLPEDEQVSYLTESDLRALLDVQALEGASDLDDCQDSLMEQLLATTADHGPDE